MKHVILILTLLCSAAFGGEVQFEVVLPSGDGVYKEARKSFFADSTTGDLPTDWKLASGRVLRVYARTVTRGSETLLALKLGPRFTAQGVEEELYRVDAAGLLVRDQPFKTQRSGSWYSDGYVRVVEIADRSSREGRVIIIVK